jgi:DNA-binding transcriptional ArsR family regulator
MSGATGGPTRRRPPTRSDPGPSDVYRAVGDLTRRAILDLLLSGPRGFRDLHGRFPLTKGAVSQHLKVLVVAGLVEIDPDDRAVRARASGPLPGRPADPSTDQPTDQENL